jgi:hypothetical protein
MENLHAFFTMEALGVASLAAKLADSIWFFAGQKLGEGCWAALKHTSIDAASFRLIRVQWCCS